MSEAIDYTASELLTVVSARLLRDGQVVFAGVGIPLLAATLAQRLHAPGLTILFEGGTVGAFVEPGKLPPSTNEQRCTRRFFNVLKRTISTKPGTPLRNSGRNPARPRAFSSVDGSKKLTCISGIV